MIFNSLTLGRQSIDTSLKVIIIADWKSAVQEA